MSLNEPLRLWVRAKPKGKARPRVTKNGTFMPPEYRKWQDAIIPRLRRQWDGEMVREPFAMHFAVVTKTGKMACDLDNAKGAILDTLKRARMIYDDRLYVHGTEWLVKRRDTYLPLGMHIVLCAPGAQSAATLQREFPELLEQKDDDEEATDEE